MNTARRRRILVVDEDRSMRDCLELHLRSAGYEVVTAPDAITAGHEIVRRPPDALIAEIDLRYMSGIELAATLVADSSLPVIPVIFLSSEPDLPVHAEALAAACLVKPFLRDDLLDAVERCVKPLQCKGPSGSVASGSIQVTAGGESERMRPRRFVGL